MGVPSLFGYQVEPNDSRGQRVSESVDIFTLYQPSAPRLDMALAALSQHQQRIEALQTQGALPSHPAKASNNYGFTDGHQYLYLSVDDVLRRPANPAWWQVALQTELDHLRGISDGVTWGLTKEIREYYWGYRGEVLYQGAYTEGMVKGVLFSLALSMTPARLGVIGWAASAMRIYQLTTTIMVFAQSSYRLATHQFRVIDAIGFIPPMLGAIRGLAFLRARLWGRRMFLIGTADNPINEWHYEGPPVTESWVLERLERMGLRIPPNILWVQAESDLAFEEALQRALTARYGEREARRLAHNIDAYYGGLALGEGGTVTLRSILNRRGQIVVTYRPSLLNHPEVAVNRFTHEIYEIRRLFRRLHLRHGELTSEEFVAETWLDYGTNWHTRLMLTPTRSRRICAPIKINFQCHLVAG